MEVPTKFINCFYYEGHEVESGLSPPKRIEGDMSWIPAFLPSLFLQAGLEIQIFSLWSPNVEMNCSVGNS